MLFIILFYGINFPPRVCGILFSMSFLYHFLIYFLRMTIPSLEPPLSPTSPSKSPESSFDSSLSPVSNKKVIDVNTIASMYDGVKNASMVIAASGSILIPNLGFFVSFLYFLFLRYSFFSIRYNSG